MEEVETRVFLDSNFIIALYNSDDSLHSLAKQMAEILKDKKFKLCISNYVFLEIVTVLSQRGSKKMAVEAGRDLFKEEDFTFIQADARIQNISWKIFQEVKQKDVSFVDCSILAVMDFYSIKSLLTFDRQDFILLSKKYRFSFI